MHKVTRNDTAKFAKVWTKNGIAFILPDVALDFATDYANIVLKSFIEQCQREAVERAKQQAARQVVITE
jgi:hypothetical protein